MGTPCWKCSEALDLPDGPVPFRQICDGCGAYIHCCVSCQHYCPGKPNDCLIPGTDLVSDREAANYCEEFVLAVEGKVESGRPEDAAKRLFGDDEEPPKKRSFDDLFG